VEHDYLIYLEVSLHWTLVNPGCSLGGDLTAEVMFNLGFLSLEGNPSLYMRELYCIYVDVYSE